MIKHQLINISILSLLFVALFTINKHTVKPKIFISKQNTAFNYSHEILRYFNLGNKRLISSLLWVQTLLESDIDHYKKKDLNSWMYLRFNTITHLDPNFYEAYLYGGKYLSIIKDDDLGAEKIYKRGLPLFPHSYDLNFNAAFHYYFELGNVELAANLFDKIKFHPKAPSFLPSLAAKLKAKDGELEAALQIATDAFKKSRNERIKKRLFETMYSLKAEIDLNCLNNQTKKCDKYDLNNHKYIKTHSGYRAEKTWKPVRPSK